MNLAGLPLHLAPEVADALASGRPVVALESSVIAQGLPWPHNLEASRRSEEAVRRGGAVPATIAAIGGEIRVGLSPAEIDRLARPAEGDRLHKLGSRDLAWAITQRGTGGTTVSATLALAAQAGIPVFATGGIGGVHRGEELDVSSDLAALARHPAAVVCAGAKVILDLPRTLEVLESLGVPVVGYRTSELPGFTCDTSGLSLEQRVDEVGALAELCRSHWALGQGSVLCVQPCPAASALPRADVEQAVAEALQSARRDGISGKAVTPYLLGAVARATGGRSIRANLDLLENNAATAAYLAVALTRRGSVRG